MNLVLVGQRASGKTAAGQMLADRVSTVFLDTDSKIEESLQLAISMIFEKHGEAFFRKAEKKVLLDAVKATDAVISVGGGAPVDEENRKALQNAGKVVWLETEPDTLINRLAGDETRPPLTRLSLEEEVEKIHDERRSVYEQTADIRLKTDKLTLEEVVLELERIWRTLPHTDLR